PTSSSFPYPSFLGNTVAGGTAPAPGFVKMDEPVASLHLGTPSFVESGGDGFINPGDFVALTLPITNYVINPATSAGKYEGIQAFLSTSTPGVTVVYNRATYPNVAVGETQSGRDPFVLAVSPSFVAGTPIELALEVKTSKGHTTLVYSQTTGTPVATTLLSENFNGVAPGSFPAGWATSHGGGTNTVPWTTNNTFCGTTSNAAFHQDAIDNGTKNPTRFERLFSPAFVVPANSQYVTIDMDVCYDTEDDPLESVLAY